MRSVIAISAVLLACCGARTDLGADEQSVSDAATGDAGMDAAFELPDAGRDAASPDARAPNVDAWTPPVDAWTPPVDAWTPSCLVDADCDDGVNCTDDRCDVGRCVQTPLDARCDDGLFCDGEERCVPSAGCVAGAAPCNDGVECTDDTCSEATRSCGAIPNPGLCPDTRDCHPVGGCVLRGVANQRGQLYELELPSGRLTPGPDLPALLTDVALRSDGVLYGISSSGLYRIDYAAGTATRTSSSIGGSGAEFGPDGELYGCGGNSVYRIDLTTGAYTIVATLGSFEERLAVSGDLVFLGDRLLLTAFRAGDRLDVLVEVDLEAGTSEIVGPIGADCVWGLAVHGPTLFGLTCDGVLLEIDPNDGSGRVVDTLTAPIWGATVR